MNRLSRLSCTLLLSLMALTCLTSCPAPYAPGTNQPDSGMIGQITKIIGTGEVLINNQIVNEGAMMQSGDHIKTVGVARATLKLARGGEVLFDADTDPVLEWISAAYCKLRILINVGSILVDTPCETVAETGSGAVINTLKTTFHLTVTSDWTELTVIKGEMTIRSNVGGTLVVPAGFHCRVLRDRPAPQNPIRVDTMEVIDWACRLDRRLCRPSPSPIVPDVVGTELDQAQQTLHRYDLKMGRVQEKETDRRSDDGLVAAQSPKQGTSAPVDAEVDLYVWRYRGGTQEMPMLLNLPLREAEDMLKDAGIRLGRIKEMKTGDQGLGGRVARQTPNAGTQIRPDTVAALIIYQYERPQTPMAKVPRLVGMHIEKARIELENSGLKIGQTYTEPPPSRRQIGFVFRQKPNAGSDMASGGTVDVWVYMTKKPIPPSLLRIQ